MCVSFPFKKEKCTIKSVHAPAVFTAFKVFMCVHACLPACLGTVKCACINAENVDVCEKAPSAPQALLSIDKTQTLFSS